MAFTAAAPIGFGNTTHGFDALRKFYTVMDEKKKEKAKEEATEFKALQSLAKVRGWADPNQITTSDLGSLRGFIKGKYDEESETVKQQELAIRQLAAERERTYAKSNVGKLASEFEALTGKPLPPEQLERHYMNALANETTGQKQMNLLAERHGQRLDEYEAKGGIATDLVREKAGLSAQNKSAEIDQRKAAQMEILRTKADFDIEDRLTELDRRLQNDKELATHKNKLAMERDKEKPSPGGKRFDLPYSEQLFLINELNGLSAQLENGMIEESEAARKRIEIEKRYSAKKLKPDAPAGAAPAAEPKKQSKIRVLAPDGKTFGFVSSDELEQAKKEGYTVPE
jgi:hypothetical protein